MDDLIFALLHFRKLTCTFLLPALLLLGACAKERDVQPVPQKLQRIAKKDLEGEFLFLKSVTRVETPTPAFKFNVAGLQLDGSHIVKLVPRENFLELYSVDPIFESEKPIEKRRLLASFPVRHVQVLPKLNADGEDTHIEEETETRKPWNEREYVLVDWTTDVTETWPSKMQRGVVLSPFQTAPPTDGTTTRGWTVERAFEDGSTLEIRYQIRQLAPPSAQSDQQAIVYPKEHQLRFGFIKKTDFGKDGFQRFTHSGKKDYLVRWDPTKPIIFHVSKSFPEKWKPLLIYAVRRWREAMAEAAGEPLIELVWNDESPPGDLSKNQIFFDTSAHDGHGLLGYAPVNWNPRTLFIEKADIYFYDRVLARALFFDELWRKSMKSPKALSLPLSDQVQFMPSKQLESGASLSLMSWSNPADIVQAARTLQAHQAENCFVSVQDGWIHPDSTTRQSLVEIENAVIGNLIFHEMGHTLGLRHNFMGSADTQHHPAGFESSTVMDYPLSPTPVTDLGEYDKHAIVFGYSADREKRNLALSKNFYYCSDEDRLTSRLGLCQAYDQGSSLTEMIKHQRDRYFASNWVYHPRWDQILFPRDAQHYDQLLMALLMPIRNAHDNADALIRAVESHDYESLWNVAGQRIESDFPCDSGMAPKDCYEIEIRPRQYEPALGGWDGKDSHPIKRYLDENKIRTVLNDAVSAKEKAVEAFRDILVFNDFPDHDVTDPVDGSVVLRGMLRDKLAAASFLAMPLADPLNPQRIITPFSTRGRYPVAGVFASLLSNTLPTEDESDDQPSYAPTFFDLQLRRHALQLLVNGLIRPGHSPEARELLTLIALPQSIKQMKEARDTPKDPLWRNLVSLIAFPQSFRQMTAADGLRQDAFWKEWKQSEKIREQVREMFFVQFLELAMTERLTPGMRVEVDVDNLKRVEMDRLSIESAFTEKSQTESFWAPAKLRFNGLPTATGLLIRDNINRAEDRMLAAQMALNKTQKDVFVANPNLNALTASPQLKGRIQTLGEYIAQERLFLEQIYLSVTRPPND